MTSRSSRRAFTSQLPMEEAAAVVLIQDKDLCVYLSECNKVIYSLFCLSFEHCLLIYSLIMSIICV